MTDISPVFIHESETGHEIVVRRKTIGKVTIFLIVNSWSKSDRLSDWMVGISPKRDKHPFYNRSFNNFEDADFYYEGLVECAELAVNGWKSEEAHP